MRRQNQLGNGDNRPTRGRGSCDTFLRGRLFCFASANLFDLEERLISKFEIRPHSYRSAISKRDFKFAKIYIAILQSRFDAPPLADTIIFINVS